MKKKINLLLSILLCICFFNTNVILAADARNEIYARKGRKFHSIELQQYFAAKEWYVPIYEPEYFDANIELFTKNLLDINNKIINIVIFFSIFWYSFI